MTEKQRLEALEVLNNHIDYIHNLGKMFGALWICISPISNKVEYSYAFFEHYTDAEDWLKEQFKIKNKFCSFVHTYLHGSLFLYKD